MPSLATLRRQGHRKLQILLRIRTILEQDISLRPQTRRLGGLRWHILPGRDVFVFELRNQVTPLSLFGQFAHLSERGVWTGSGRTEHCEYYEEERE